MTAFEQGLKIRLALSSDAAAMCAVLNPLIEAGGTTANETPWSEDQMRGMIEGFGPRDFAFVAERGGRIIGFQYVEAHPALDPGTGDIASFVDIGEGRGGVGRALAARTLAEARTRGWRKLFAYIRADNTGGLAYYEHIGFRTIRTDPAVPLKNGTPVDRVAKLLSL